MRVICVQCASRFLRVNEHRTSWEQEIWRKEETGCWRNARPCCECLRIWMSYLQDVPILYWPNPFEKPCKPERHYLKPKSCITWHALHHVTVACQKCRQCVTVRRSKSSMTTGQKWLWKTENLTPLLLLQANPSGKTGTKWTQVRLVQYVLDVSWHFTQSLKPAGRSPGGIQSSPLVLQFPLQPPFV